MSQLVDIIQSVQLDDHNDCVVILDQTKLPNQKIYRHLSTATEVWEAIVSLQVRGAPAIGIAAAFGVYLGVKKAQVSTIDELHSSFLECKDYLASSRPTAVNLFWALERMENRFLHDQQLGFTQADILKGLKEEAENIRTEDEKTCEAIGEYALSLLKPGSGLLTHCNAGTIATAKYGTALAPIYLGQQKGYQFKVFAGETRPLLQGARLTTWELSEASVDVTLICDNMASIVMKQGKIDAVLVGCDRVASNGDTANKIGTSGLAILAKHYQIPFYVCAPTSTIDFACLNGEEIIIEERSGAEITDQWYQESMAPSGIKTYNPAFDVTDHSLITAIVTEKGIFQPQYLHQINN